MTPEDKNEPSPSAERPESSRQSFREKMRAWLKSRRNEEKIFEVRDRARTVFYEFQPDETALRSEVDETVYAIDVTVSSEEVLPRIGDRVVISNPSRESEYAFYYVLSRPQDPGELPRLQIDQVVLPTDENRLLSPAVSVYFDMPEQTMLNNLALTDDGETWSLPAGTRTQRIMPLDLIDTSSDEEDFEGIESEISRITIQSRFDPNREELAKVLKELDRPR